MLMNVTGTLEWNLPLVHAVNEYLVTSLGFGDIHFLSGVDLLSGPLANHLRSNLNKENLQKGESLLHTTHGVKELLKTKNNNDPNKFTMTKLMWGLFPIKKNDLCSDPYLVLAGHRNLNKHQTTSNNFNNP